jgi:hypothetical protein
MLFEGLGPHAARGKSCPLGRQSDTVCALSMSVHRGILLQKSKVAPVRIFGEILKRESIDDSYGLSRVAEIAYEFSVRR